MKGEKGRLHSFQTSFLLLVQVISKLSFLKLNVPYCAGEGVIGQYPILEPGGKEFVYQSCTHQTGVSSSMEGEFKCD